MVLLVSGLSCSVTPPQCKAADAGRRKTCVFASHASNGHPCSGCPDYSEKRGECDDQQERVCCNDRGGRGGFECGRGVCSGESRWARRASGWREVGEAFSAGG